jgi:hypothetical protein
MQGAAGACTRHLHPALITYSLVWRCVLALLVCSPVGTYSAEGARGSCTACPAGQYNPSEGLGDQTLVGSSLKCLACPAGSLALSNVNLAAADAVADDLTTGATFCDAW